MKAIIAERLTKIYSGEKKALDNASIELSQGEVFGFLGPNGAGKPCFWHRSLVQSR